MKCNDIQEKLSAYIEGFIPVEERAAIEEHLETCQKCRTSLQDLEKTISYVKNLAEMEPPAWLSQKVMARVRQESRLKNGIFHKLFYPLHIKLPVQAIAIVLIAVSALYVFKTIQPEIKPYSVTEDEMTIPQVKSKDKDVLSESIKPERFSPTDEMPRPATSGIRGRDREVDAGTAVPEGEPGESLKRKEMDRLSMDRKEEVRAYEFMKPSQSESMKQLYHAGQPEAGGETKEALKKEETVEKEAMKTLSDDMIKEGPAAGGISVKTGELSGETEKHPDIKLAVDSLENSLKDIEGTVERLGGKILQIEKFKDMALVVVACNASKTDELLNGLRPLGEIEEKDIGSEQGEGKGELIIQILVNAKK